MLPKCVVSNISQCCWVSFPITNVILANLANNDTNTARITVWHCIYACVGVLKILIHTANWNVWLKFDELSFSSKIQQDPPIKAREIKLFNVISKKNKKGQENIKNFTLSLLVLLLLPFIIVAVSYYHLR